MNATADVVTLRGAAELLGLSVESVKVHLYFGRLRYALPVAEAHVRLDATLITSNILAVIAPEQYDLDEIKNLTGDLDALCSISIPLVETPTILPACLFIHHRDLKRYRQRAGNLFAHYCYLEDGTLVAPWDFEEGYLWLCPIEIGALDAEGYLSPLFIARSDIENLLGQEKPELSDANTKQQTAPKRRDGKLVKLIKKWLLAYQEAYGCPPVDEESLLFFMQERLGDRFGHEKGGFRIDQRRIIRSSFKRSFSNIKSQ